MLYNSEVVHHILNSYIYNNIDSDTYFSFQIYEYFNGSEERLNLKRETSGVEVESDGNTILEIVNKLNTD